MDPTTPARPSAAGRSQRKTRWLAPAVLVASVVLGVGMFALSRHANQREESRLLSSQAQDARTAITASMGQLESTLSSVGSVADATSGDPAAFGRLAQTDPVVRVFAALAVFHRSADGAVGETFQTGNPSEPIPGMAGAPGRELTQVIDHGGSDIVGFFGTGKQRRLAVAAGAPLVPGGYTVYAEVPLPEDTTAPSGFPNLEFALFLGNSTTGQVLFSSPKALPLHGEQVRQRVDINDLAKAATGPEADLLFVVEADGSLVGTLSDLLPWILGGVAIAFGLLVAFAVEITSRRKDQALALVSDLEDKNAALDRSMAEQVKSEQDRMRLEGELRQSQRLEAVGRLAGGVAHDFNNLLAAVMTYSEFIAGELAPDHPVQEDVAEVRKAAKRAAELTRQLLVFSRRDLVKPSVLDVNDAITDLLNLLRRTLGEDVELTPELAEKLPRVLADPGELEQVLVNLAVNARDAIAGQGTIKVQTSEHLIDEDAAFAHPDLRPGRFVRIAVTDTGSGMTPEVQSKVFEPFFTTKGPGVGTGLGLSTVYAIANRYGGFVTIYSEVGVGTTVKVYLPATEDKADQPISDQGADAGGQDTGETVLLVEDEESVRNACRRILERAGFHVIEASDGAQALTELGDDTPIDLLLTDVIMPGDVSGKDLAARLQESRPGLPVLFMSGYTADVIAKRGILEPGITVVEKPFTSSDLLGKVRELLV